MNRSFPLCLTWLALVFSLLSLVACEESVDPFIGSEYPFTIWGFMNAGSDTQYVRVYEVGEEILPHPDAEIDAEVFSTNLTTGERREWSYKKVEFDSAFAGHVFWSSFRADHEHRYRLEVIRSDDEASSAEVTVPSEIDVEIEVDDNSVVVPVRIIGDVPNLVGPKVSYEAINIPPANAWPPGLPIHPPVVHPVVVSYEENLRESNEGWVLTINMVRDTTHVRDEFRKSCLITGPGGSAPNVWLRNVEFSFVAADSAWRPPGGVFDPDVLAVPGTMSNVENGYGFFGAGQGVRVSWTPSVESRQSAGYGVEARCTRASGGVGPVPECMNPPIPCIGENAQSVWELWLR